MKPSIFSQGAAVLILFCMPLLGGQAAGIQGHAQPLNPEMHLQSPDVLPAVPGEAPSQVRNELIFLELEWLHTNNPEALNRILADDFVDVVPYGSITKQQILEQARQDRLMFDRYRKLETGVNVRVFGDTGIVTGFVLLMNVEGRIVARYRFTHVYVSRDARWQAVNAQEMPATPQPTVRLWYP
ncbi:MAG: nuclear transport factor 2 family protein [Acidobacteriota bacterium]|nr:nuclear transport factor 2 family protein [Acidobacteriota bacterium]